MLLISSEFVSNLYIINPVALQRDFFIILLAFCIFGAIIANMLNLYATFLQ